jgi:ABC-type transporter Mla subunit MlaD
MAQGNPKAAEDLADLVYTNVINHAAEITTAAGSLTVHSTHLNGRRNEFEHDLETSAKLYSVVLEFDIIHAI